MKGDKRAIFTAASHAQKAADYLNGLQPKAATATGDAMQEAT
jgi:antirestriction protein ArdC